MSKLILLKRGVLEIRLSGRSRPPVVKLSTIFLFRDDQHTIYVVLQEAETLRLDLHSRWGDRLPVKPGCQVLYSSGVNVPVYMITPRSLKVI